MNEPLREYWEMRAKELESERQSLRESLLTVERIANHGMGGTPTLGRECLSRISELAHSALEGESGVEP